MALKWSRDNEGNTSADCKKKILRLLKVQDSFSNKKDSSSQRYVNFCFKIRSEVY